MKALIIAEVGVNHNGDLGIARRLIEAAADAGTDLVKFQTFVASDLATPVAPKAQYQISPSCLNESQHDMLSSLELSRQDFVSLKEECRRHNIELFSTAFDDKSITLVSEFNDTDYVKVPSGEITNTYLRRLAVLGKNVILSTGMSDLSDVDLALRELERNGVNRKDITVLHCNTEYPTPAVDVNLSAMVTMGSALGVNFGYSDHTAGIEIPIAAVALGASIIEKHLTLDRSLAGPDHQASLEPHEFRLMTQAIRKVEVALGDGVKRVSPSETKNRAIVRKSIVAAKQIREEIFRESNLTTKRPGTGISPMRWDELIGRAAERDFKVNEQIEI